jgi:hypothetical protein
VDDSHSRITLCLLQNWIYRHCYQSVRDSNIFDPLTRARANNTMRILISDCFGTHESLEAMTFSCETNIILCRLPSQISQKFQPCDMEAVLLACLTFSSDSEREKSPLHQLGIVFCARFATKACVELHHSLFVGTRASKAAPPRAASSC